MHTMHSFAPKSSLGGGGKAWASKGGVGGGVLAFKVVVCRFPVPKAGPVRMEKGLLRLASRSPKGDGSETSPFPPSLFSLSFRAGGSELSYGNFLRNLTATRTFSTLGL